MAKYRSPSKGHETGKQVTTKSWFGSHDDMVVDPVDFGSGGAAVTLKDNEVICQDDRGYYTTLTSRLDDGLADPNRYSSHRLEHD
jgi:hypothetical protein